uniref:Thyroid adenoma-associated n=5 Tax=Lygus hesperus TaxID=30085 RepID=A0A146M6J7_LYGHE
MAIDSTIAGTLSHSLNCLKQPSLANDSKYFIVEFRSIITSCQKLTSTSNSLLPPCLGQLADTLLTSLGSLSHLSLEARSLCGVALALVLCTISEPSSVALMYSKSFLSPSASGGETLRVRLYKGAPELSISISSDDLSTFRLCLAHGLLQIQPQSFWLSPQVSQSTWHSLLVGRMFPLLETEAFTYSHRTLLAFKSLVVWAKRFRLNTMNGRLSSSLAISLLNIIASNWENPFNGVREQNSLLLEQLLAMTSMEDNEEIPTLLRPPNLVELVLTEMSWKVKSKFFFLSVIIPVASPLSTVLSFYEDLIEGLVLSLQYTHLVSAGTELYRVILEYIPQDKWSHLFLPRILTILSESESTLAKLNLFNYWMGPTIKKYRNCLDLVYDGLRGQASTKLSDDIILSIVLTLKLGRKEGYEEMSWPAIRTSPYLSLALTHQNEHIRTTAFAVVCVSSKTSGLITTDEFTLVRNFLEENVNSDSSPLRQALINSFTTLLVRLRDSCLQALRTHEGVGCDGVVRSMTFLEWLFRFLASCLEIGSNYQRKITALELYKVVLSYLADENGGERKSNAKADGQRVMKHCIAVGKWGFTSEIGRESLLFCISDSAEDVRESAARLLATYFKIIEPDASRFNLLFNKGVSLCGDPMFYNSEAGALLVYTVTCLSYKGGLGATKFLDIKFERVCSGLLPHAENQFAALKTDILLGATGGSPLYGILRAVGRLELDPSSPEYHTLSPQEINRFVNLVEAVVHHLLQVLASKSTSISDYAPSFLEMGEAIKSVVEGSALNVEESDKFQLSPAYQLVLNTIWLNLKICCWIASKLPDAGVDPNRCLSLILSILRQTKHKGALEAAGSSLGTLVKSLSVTPHASLLDDTLVQSLDRLAGGTTESTRGAGSVILLHRLVANDIRLGKPMVGKCLEKLVGLVERRTGHTSQALHLLAVLLKDRSLSQETAKVIHRLAAASFACLSHSSWAVRNTGLQLFGAIVPRLVGQRKPSENDSSCSCYHLPYEELYYHGQTLVNNMLDQLSRVPGNSPCDHASLVPVLSLLSSLCIGLLTIINRELSTVIFDKFFAAFRSLMSSPISKVRQLAAEASAWFCSPSQIASIIRMHIWKITAFINDRSMENEIKTENELHGFLLNTKFLLERFQSEKKGVSALRKAEQEVEVSLEELRRVSQSMNISFVCKSVVAELVGCDDHVIFAQRFDQLSSSLSEQHKALGMAIWKDIATEQIVLKCSYNDLLFCVRSAYDSENPEVINSTLCALKQRIPVKEFESVSNPILSYLLRLMVDGNPSEDLRRVVFEILCHHKPHNLNDNMETIINLLLKEGTIISIAVACGLLSLDQESEKQMIEEVVVRLRTFIEPSEYEETRLIASRALSLMYIFISRPINDEDASSPFVNSIRSKLWEIGITLLEDENPIVRVEATKFASSVIEASHPQNPYICLRKMMDPTILIRNFHVRDIVNCLLSRLECSQEELASLENDDAVHENNEEIYLNPFSNSSENEYAEPIKGITLAVEGLLSLIQSDPSVSRYIEDVIAPDMKALEKQGHKLVEFSASSFHRLLIDSRWYLIGRRLSSRFLVAHKVRSSKIW